VRPVHALLLAANLVYATSYVAARLVLDDLPPALLALVRVVGGAAVLVPVVRLVEGRAGPLPRGDAWRIVWMGVIGFAGAFALGNWGLLQSTATNAALLIIVEPLSIMLLGPALLGERLTRRQAFGAALAALGAIVVVLNGIPGITHALVPHGRGDVLLVLSGVAYGSYTLIGRDVLARHSALRVTARSILWGIVAMLPLAGLEWAAGVRPQLTAGAIVGGLYLAVVITAGGYLLWNWTLARVAAPEAAIFITVQPIGGAVLGVLVLGEPLTPFTVAGGVLVVLGLWLSMRGGD
jgi:drug/metabolite transporter (DMT)-like permease